MYFSFALNDGSWAFKYVASSCRDANENVVTNSQGIPSIVVEAKFFYDDHSSVTRAPNLNNDKGVDIPPPSHDEVKVNKVSSRILLEKIRPTD